MKMKFIKLHNDTQHSHHGKIKPMKQQAHIKIYYMCQQVLPSRTLQVKHLSALYNMPRAHYRQCNTDRKLTKRTNL